jgi:hypothetical protein|tara:strand:- start:2513 stop:2698 length:186 start_codon:yes stop_codon:yes gene_type:complete
MANRTYDVSGIGDMNAITGSDAGSVTNDVSIVIKEGADRDNVVVAINAVADLIAGNQIIIN